MQNERVNELSCPDYVTGSQDSSIDVARDCDLSLNTSGTEDQTIGSCQQFQEVMLEDQETRKRRRLPLRTSLNVLL
jgi:hypothetical protein